MGNSRACPRCNNALLGKDEDGDYCMICGWHDYGEMPKTIRQDNKYWNRGDRNGCASRKDRGCSYATRELRKRTGNRQAKSKCLECPFPNECIKESGLWKLID